MELINIILAGIFIIICSIEDIKSKQVSLKICIIFSIIGIITGVFGLNKSIIFFLGSVIPSIIIAVVSIITRNGIGMGDAIIIGVLGLYLGVSDIILILMMALLISGVYGCYLLIIKKKNGKDTLAFVPFILCSFIIVQGGII